MAPRRTPTQCALVLLGLLGTARAQCTVTGLPAPYHGALDAACADGAPLADGESCALTCDSGWQLASAVVSAAGTGVDVDGTVVVAVQPSCTGTWQSRSRMSRSASVRRSEEVENQTCRGRPRESWSSTIAASCRPLPTPAPTPRKNPHL